jgi:hypothetical protein
MKLMVLLMILQIMVIICNAIFLTMHAMILQEIKNTFVPWQHPPVYLRVLQTF